MRSYTLGLDMGVASIGWAAVSADEKKIESGVRIFPPGVDKFGTGKDTHLNQKRRQARGARRRQRRKGDRKLLIRKILTGLGWVPNAPEKLHKWEQLDVYMLRAKAVKERVELDELARIILHLNQRRGFLSLRKSEVAAAEGDAKKELEGMLGEIDALEQAIQDSGSLTLGEYLYGLYQKDGISVRLRNRHIRRQMLHKEFSLIWEKQAEFHPELTDALRYGSFGKREDPVAVVKPVPRTSGETHLQQFGIENLSFFQRRVYWPISSIGRCELEPNELRAPVADRRFQKFRMLSELNNLRLLDQSAIGKPTERKLSVGERAVALVYLSSTQKPTFGGLRKAVAKAPGAPSVRQIVFNLENGTRDKISGLVTENQLRKAVGEAEWDKLSEDEKNQIVEVLTLPESGQSKVIQRTDSETKDLLVELSTLKIKQIEKLLRVPLPSGYCGLSIKALEKLMPHMEAGFGFQGKDETDSARHLAGYPRRDETVKATYDLLPRLEAMSDRNDEHYDPNFPDVNNPLVLRALHELRKVVNGVIRKHGKPARIHVEMARDLKMHGKRRDEYIKKQRDRENERDRAAEALEEHGVLATRDAITLYLLWEEQNKACAYSHPARMISIQQLLGGEVDIDHIYPRRANDDSYMNKVVCFASENRQKSDRLPSKWLENNPEKYEALVQRSKSLPYPKRLRLLADSVPEDFAARDAVDTAYMTKVARHYLTCLVDQPHLVFCTKGKHTALLRRHWEINDLLRDDLLDVKNRDDHRHHALDAIVTALCGPDLVQKLSKELHYENRWKDFKKDLEKDREKNGKERVVRRVYRLKPIADGIDSPWEKSTFRESVKSSLDRIWVSHRPSRKLSGPLHEETNYGATQTPGEIVRRKPLSSLTEKEIEKIRDVTVRQVVKDYLVKEKRLYRQDFGKALKGDLAAVFSERDSITTDDIKAVPEAKLRGILEKKLKSKNPLVDADHGLIKLPSGIPIKKARIVSRSGAAVPRRQAVGHELVVPGNTHHVAIFVLSDGSHHFVPVTLLEASRRLKERKPVVDPTPPVECPDAEFLMHLCSDDSILAEVDGITELFVLNTISSGTLQMAMLHHCDARDSKNRKPVRCRPGTFAKNFPNARKVTVLPNGELRNIDRQ